MSSMNQALQAKIDSRKAAVTNLDKVLTGEQSSVRILRDQLAEHEVAMADRVDAGTDNIRWTTWADRRLAGLQMQLAEGERRIEKILETIVGHEAAIRDFASQFEGSSGRPVFVAVSKKPKDEKPAGFAGKTMMDLDRKGPSKNPGRRYIAKGERKKSAEPKSAKKDKSRKNQRRGRRAA